MKPIVYLLFPLLLGSRLAFAQAAEDKSSIGLEPVSTIKILPMYALVYDVPSIRLGYQWGTRADGWQAEAGYVPNIREAVTTSEYENSRFPNSRGFALQLGKYWALNPESLTYFMLTGEYRRFTYDYTGWVGQDCSDGQCNYERLVTNREPVVSPTVHAMFGKSFLTNNDRLQIDMEMGIGYKWAFGNSYAIDDIFLLDFEGDNGEIRRKMSFRLNLNIGFRTK
jgi:hypothetical protein